MLERNTTRIWLGASLLILGAAIAEEWTPPAIEPAPVFEDSHTPAANRMAWPTPRLTAPVGSATDVVVPAVAAPAAEAAPVTPPAEHPAQTIAAPPPATPAAESVPPAASPVVMATANETWLDVAAGNYPVVLIALALAVYVLWNVWSTERGAKTAVTAKAPLRSKPRDSATSVAPGSQVTGVARYLAGMAAANSTPTRAAETGVSRYLRQRSG